MQIHWLWYIIELVMYSWLISVLLMTLTWAIQKPTSTYCKLCLSLLIYSIHCGTVPFSTAAWPSGLQPVASAMAGGAGGVWSSFGLAMRRLFSRRQPMLANDWRLWLAGLHPASVCNDYGGQYSLSATASESWLGLTLSARPAGWPVQSAVAASRKRVAGVRPTVTLILNEALLTDIMIIYWWSISDIIGREMMTLQYWYL